MHTCQPALFLAFAVTRLMPSVTVLLIDINMIPCNLCKFPNCIICCKGEEMGDDWRHDNEDIQVGAR